MTTAADIADRLDDMSRTDLQRAFIDLWVQRHNAFDTDRRRVRYDLLLSIARALGYEVK